MKQRIMAVLVCGILMSATLTGCGGSEKTTETEQGEPEIIYETTDGEIIIDDQPLEEPEEILLELSGGEGTESAIQVILSGFSTRAFSDEVVSDADLEAVLLSGSRAPSARNSQPWHFTAVRDVALGGEMVPIMTDGTVVIVVSGVREPEEGINPDYDCALATQNMVVAAWSLGLGAHIYTSPVSGINETMRDALELPAGYDAVAVLCIGHIEDYADAVSSASQRNPLSDLVNYIG